MEKRRVFNYRRILFSARSIPEKYRTMSLNELAEEILRKAFYLCELAGSNGPISPDLWIHFFDEISLLQMIDITTAA